VKGEIICGYRLLCELGSRALPAYAAVDPKPRRPSEALCVVEPLTREGGVAAEAAAEFLREAKRVATLRHPNVASVRDVVVGASTVMLVSDWIDGEVLSDIELRTAEKSIPIPLAGSLRIVVDILEGLSALHELRDAKREPLRLVHAEVAPRNIVVGSDGRSVLVHPLRAPAGVSRAHSPEVLGYLAPEVLLGDQTADQRADVYGCGVLLWEALMGQRMHAEGEDTGEIVMRLLGGKIDAPCAPVSAPWAAPLAAAAKKAIAPDPSVRFASATEMLDEVRKVAGAHLAPKLAVAALVEAVVGEEIRARRERLGGPITAARLPSESAWTTDRAETKDPDASAPLPLASGSEADPDITKPPPMPTSSRTSTRTDGVSSSARWQRREAPMPFPLRTPSESSSEVSIEPAPTPAAIPISSSALIETRPSEPPLSADVVEVVDIDVASARPSGSRRPPPLRARQSPSGPAGEPDIDPFAIPGPPLPPRIETPFAQTKPSALDITAASGAVTTARTWTFVGAFAIAAGVVVLWIFARTPPASSETVPVAAAPVVSVEPSPLAPPVPASASSPPAATTATAAANEPSPFDPQPADDHAPSTPTPSSPAPAATKPTRAVLPTSSPATPPPAAAPATPPAQAALAPAAATPSPAPHPKKHAFDPMGI
jgi:serine/threonine-protein kinase